MYMFKTNINHINQLKSIDFKLKIKSDIFIKDLFTFNFYLNLQIF